jgi:hypothetical protein
MSSLQLMVRCRFLWMMAFGAAPMSSKHWRWALRAVLIARPYLWGLAVNGQDGVTHVLSLLRSEIERALALIGRPSIAGLDRTVLVDASSAAVPGAARQ